MTTTAAVRTRGLVKRYGATTALHGLDLEVRAGEVYGFIGPNGAGKTTTIRVLLDLVRPTAGTVEVLGEDPRRGGASLRQRISYLPGDVRLHDRGSVADVVDVFASMRAPAGPAREALRRRASEVAQRLGLDPSRTVRALSKGNRQKVGIVLALMPGADLLVLDEPTSGLDPLVQQEFLALVREERAAGRTVLMSSHVLSEVEEVADRVGIIRSGTLVDVDSVAAVRARAARVVEVRLGSPEDAALLARALAGTAGVAAVVTDGSSLRCTVSGTVAPFVRALAPHDVVDLGVRAPDLEEVFLGYYAAPEVQHDDPVPAPRG